MSGFEIGAVGRGIQLRDGVRMADLREDENEDVHSA